jgi:hypothetical protein
MNATFIELPQSAGIPTATRDDSSRPLRIFVAFEDETALRKVVVLIKRVAPEKSCVAERCRLRETIQVTCPRPSH